ncbi:hypothetical protein RB49p196.1 [Escherichia phage RB49]|uniref:Uncharacterized protein n=1 Tax=Escherichia phage RB49 TaxID=50948 RepID=B2GM58_BPRB4|nr:hypothetical protein RB49p196.1 [Escherichia phage RB49]ACC93485.1 hypothetical protein RB49p196.1 [Escherichia phage RB49]
MILLADLSVGFFISQKIKKVVDNLV